MEPLSPMTPMPCRMSAWAGAAMMINNTRIETARRKAGQAHGDKKFALNSKRNALAFSEW